MRLQSKKALPRCHLDDTFGSHTKCHSILQAQERQANFIRDIQGGFVASEFEILQQLGRLSWVSFRTFRGFVEIADDQKAAFLEIADD